ncbi:MAG TPA: NRAMP family divalent metal transporter [Nocardioidaceae bacterium]|nr:NRAMP family divalent metal transporter [Nocardioidaceae bacterium]
MSDDAKSPPPATETQIGTSIRATLLGAMFLMATSAIGPGFITQTAEFTGQLGAAFAFAILISILVDIAIQLNIWRVIGVSGQRAHELGNRVLPGLGWFMSLLIVIGGLVFNIGNVSGTGLGAEAMLGLDPTIGGVISAAIAIGIFLSRRAGIAMDRVVVVLGLVMIALTTYVAITSGPPVVDALRNTVLPENVEFLVITTLIGGTVGGYITYSGAHRLVDSGVVGPERVRDITRGSVIGIIITGIMRVVLFLAILGVVAGGVSLATDNPPATAFEAAAGEVGLRVFGIVFWAAAISSVIGASYTSVSFLTSATGISNVRRNWLVIAFIVISTVVFVFAGEAPVTLLVFAGAFNGILLPVGVGVMLWVAWRRRDLLRGYRYPPWLLTIGVLAWLLCLYLAYSSLEPMAELFASN